MTVYNENQILNDDVHSMKKALKNVYVNCYWSIKRNGRK